MIAVVLDLKLKQPAQACIFQFIIMSCLKTQSCVMQSCSVTVNMVLQVVVFDLEFGQPAASSSLPASRPPFRDILGCFGHQAIGKDVTEGGIDLLFCSHQVCCCLT